MKVLTQNKTCEIVEKKSRFIASLYYVDAEDKAESILQDVRKKYYDAKHHTFAYVIGKNGDIVKSSDDGEPSGTAGHPMLDILKGNEITNCIAIVVRYFGGTLLGTGGLVRCYSDSLKLSVMNSKFSCINSGYHVSFDIGYDDYGKVLNRIDNINKIETSKLIVELKKDFQEKVHIEYLIHEKAFDSFKKEIMDISKGLVTFENTTKKYYYLNKNCDIIYI